MDEMSVDEALEFLESNPFMGVVNIKSGEQTFIMDDVNTLVTHKKSGQVHNHSQNDFKCDFHSDAFRRLHNNEY